MDTCPQCGNEYKSISIHWERGSCEHPSLTNKQREIITGLLMGDGYINRNSKNPYVQSNMITHDYLKYVDRKLGIFGNGVSLYRTAKESAKQAKDRNFSPNAEEKNYSDVYRWQSKCHPELQEFANWYSSGKKVWPANIELTPTVLKHWYCGDGSFSNSGCEYIKIGMWNEVNRADTISKMFEKAGLPNPTYCVEEHNCVAQFSVFQSEELWEYMGGPLPGFEYKWPDRHC